MGDNLRRPLFGRPRLNAISRLLRPPTFSARLRMQTDALPRCRVTWHGASAISATYKSTGTSNGIRSTVSTILDLLSAAERCLLRATQARVHIGSSAGATAWGGSSGPAFVWPTSTPIFDALEREILQVAPDLAHFELEPDRPRGLVTSSRTSPGGRGDRQGRPIRAAVGCTFPSGRIA